MDWTKVNMAAAKIAAAENGWIKSSDTEGVLKTAVAAQTLAEQARLTSRISELLSNDGMFAVLLEQQKKIDGAGDARKWAEEKMATALLGLKGFSAVLGAILGILAIFGISSVSDIRSQSKELESIKDSYRKEVDTARSSKLYLTLELAKVRQRSNRLLEVMQRIKNDEFSRSFQDFYGVLPYQPGDYSKLDRWLHGRMDNISQMEKFLALENTSLKISKDILVKATSKLGNKSQATDEENAKNIDGGSEYSVDFDTFRSLINFRSLRLQHRLFDLLFKWADAERLISEADPSKKQETSLDQLDRLEKQWVGLEPESYFGTKTRLEWETATRGKESASIRENDDVDQIIAESPVTIQQDRELWDLITQAAILRGIVLCNIKTKVFNIEMNNQNRTAPELKGLEDQIIALANDTGKILSGGYGNEKSASRASESNLGLQGVERLRSQTVTQRSISEKYCIEFYKNVTSASRAIKSIDVGVATAQEMQLLEHSIKAMEAAGQELTNASLPEQAAYHKNVMANFFLWQSIAFQKNNLLVDARTSLDQAQEASENGLAITRSEANGSRGSRSSLLILTDAEVKISKLYMEMTDPETSKIKTKKEIDDDFRDIMSLFETLFGSEEAQVYLRNRHAAKVPLKRFEWFYGLANERGELRVFNRLGVKNGNVGP
jgi:hypothetical protein